LCLFFSNKEEGTGLGLSISKKIVENYGGSITASGSVNGGACLTVYLPDQNSDSDAAKQTDSDFKNLEDSL
jgi:signal transduction histidine kinase